MKEAMKAMRKKRKQRHNQEEEAPRSGAGSVFLLIVLLGFIAFIAVSGCDGVPVMPAANPEAAGPEAANLYAYATQTGASLNSTATRAQYQLDYAGTSAAVVAQETAAASIVTSQAQATATSDHVLAVAAADVTREYAQIINERERVISTATSIAMQRQIQADAQEAMRRQDRAAFNALAWKVAVVALGTVGVVALVAVLWVGIWRWWNKPDYIQDANGNPVAISKNYQQMRHAPAPHVQVMRAVDVAAHAPERTASLNGQTTTSLHEAPVVLEYAGQRVTFYPRQIAKIRQWVLGGDYGVRRDNSMEGFGLRELGVNSSAYGLTLSVLQGKGYVSKDAPYRWTDVGLTEFLGLALDDE